MHPSLRTNFRFVALMVLALMVLAACGEEETEPARDGAAPDPTQATGMVASPTASLSEPSTATPEADAGTAEEAVSEPESPAPELTTAGDWYNSEPLTLAELRGKPVLLVFWATY